MLADAHHTNGTPHEGLNEPDLTFASIFRAISFPASLSTLDEGCFLTVNGAWERLFGYSSQEVIGRTGADLDLWVRPAKHAELVRQLQASRSLRDYEYQMRAKSGAVRDVLVTAQVVESNGRRHILSLVDDITEPRRAEELMRRQTVYLEALHQVTLGVVSELNVDDLLEKLLERAVSLLGAAYGWLYLVTPEEDAIELKVGTGTLLRFKGTRLKRGEGLSGKIWETGEFLAVESYQSWHGRSEIFEGEAPGPAIGMPLKSSGQVIGVIGLTRAVTDSPFNADEQALGRRFGNLAEIALKNARLHTSLETELAERARAEKALQDRLAFERLITNISTEFINLEPDQIDSGIEEALGAIGEFTGSDRSYVMLFSPDGKLVDNTHEWCRAGVESHQARHRNQSVERFPSVIPRVKQGEVVIIPSYDNIPERQVERDRALSHTPPTQSVIVVPLAYRGKVVGQLGFDSVRKKTAWSEDSIALLRIVGEIFVNALEHKRASEALRRSELRFRTMFENAGMGIAIVGWDEDTIQSNPAVCKILGYSQEEFGHLDSPDYTWPEDYPVQKMLDDEMMAGQRDGYQIEKRYIRKDGEMVWGRLTQSVARDTTGKVLYQIAMVEDITEQKLAAQKLAEAYQTLEQRVAERTHELATINAISTSVSHSLDLKQIMRDALDKIMDIMQMEYGVAYRVEGDASDLTDQEYLKILAHRGFSAEFVRFADGLPVRETAAGFAGGQGKPMAWRVADLPITSDKKQRLDQEGVRLVVSIPLVAKGRYLGTLNIGSAADQVITQEQLVLLGTIGQQVGVAVDNARLYEEAERSAQAAERSRLARELHDSVTQSLYSITLYAEATARLLTRGREEEAVVRLRDLRDTAQEALRAMRLLIFELRPPALDKGLAVALQTRLDSVESRCGVRADLQIEGKVDLAFDIQAELYHIALEALNNALKHARAESVHVHLVQSKALVHMQIRDDGTGFETVPATKRGGFGISGMRERAQRIGGTLEITSAPGQGTCVTVEVGAAAQKSEEGLLD